MSTTENYAKEDKYDGKTLGLYWREQLDHAEKVFSTWDSRGTKVVDRYRDERDAADRLRSKFNILWSNTQILIPSLYGRAAKPEVSRRYMDADPVGRLASTILERAIEYEVQQFPDFDAAMTSSVEDRLLPGRGTVWIRYDPLITSEEIPPPDGLEITSTEEPVTVDTVESAHTPVDYVYWKDFLHSPARTWDEVWWCARWVYLTKDEGVERFGEVFNNVPLNEYKEDNSKNSKDKTQGNSFAKKAKIAEIWNKRDGKVCWVAKDYPQALDECDDPLELEGFFPCPKPLYATTTNGSLVPVPDYCEYEDQARELDTLTGRITVLVKAIKAAGVYNGAFKELGRLLSESTDNKLFPVDNWGAFAEKNGLKGAIDLLDNSTVVQALAALYNAREVVKQTIYEICGISDILRGASKAEETLGAQQLKAQFGSLRLRASQGDVARFASDIFRLKAQIICKFYPAELIVKMSGIQNTDDGRNPQLLEQAVQILKESTSRDFHITVESDSLAQIDDDAEKQAASEAITAIGGFIKEALPMAQSAPETLPMVKEMLLFLTRRFRAGRSLESSIEQSMNLIQQNAQAAAANPKPSKEQIEAQMQQQADQMRAQADQQTSAMKAQHDSQVQQAKLEAEGQLEQMKMQMDAQSRAHEAQLEQISMAKAQQFELQKAQADANTKLQLADKDAEKALRIAEMQQATAIEVAHIGAQSKLDALGTQAVADSQMQSAEIQAETQMQEASIAATADDADKARVHETDQTEAAQEHETSMSAEDAPQMFALRGKSDPPADAAVEVHIHDSAPEDSKPDEPPRIERDANGKATGASNGKGKHFKIIRDEKGKMSGFTEVSASE